MVLERLKQTISNLSANAGKAKVEGLGMASCHFGSSAKACAGRMAGGQGGAMAVMDAGWRATSPESTPSLPNRGSATHSDQEFQKNRRFAFAPRAYFRFPKGRGMAKASRVFAVLQCGESPVFGVNALARQSGRGLAAAKLFEKRASARDRTAYDLPLVRADARGAAAAAWPASRVLAGETMRTAPDFSAKRVGVCGNAC